MMHLNLTYLKYFYDAVIHKSMSAAARENFVSQSAISQGIIKLEIALGAHLTTHQKQKFTLTEEGSVVFEEAKHFFSLVTGLKDRLNALRGEVAGEIKFACPNSLAQFYVPNAYLSMKKHYPKVHLKFHRGGLNFIHEELRREKVSFALVLDAPEFEKYDRETISQGCFRLYKKKGLKNTSGVLVDHLENYEVKELRERFKEKHGKNLEILDTFSGWVLVLAFIQLDHGIGYLPDFMAKDNKNLEEVDVGIKPIQYSISMIKPRGSSLTRSEKAFLNILRE